MAVVAGKRPSEVWSRAYNGEQYGQEKIINLTSSSGVGGGGGGLKGFSSSANRLHGGSFDLTVSDVMMMYRF